ncbi:XRE family transcriptional regulator [Saccharothrix syringae]|uniref:XRE family transcriptional regulator n=2 Tax=Saccharothrix syringae TaxID=103733 RepID=A0A5Q0HEN0_SACSY|nr:XRE family transcriptional regulator [Saccharothrix syringae]
MRHRLAAELRHLRGLSGISGRELGRRIAISQSKVSRIESGSVLPSMPEVVAWSAAVEASPATRSRLASLTRGAHDEARSWRGLLHGRGHLQDEIARREALATRIRTYQHSVVPGLLQTAEYARRVFSLFPVPYSDDDLAAAVASRVERQRLVFEPHRRFDFLITEAALRWRPGPLPLLLAQFDRLASVSTLDNVSLGLIPNDADASTTLSHGFVIYYGPHDGGDGLVTVEMAHRPVEVTDSDDIELYENRWTLLQRMAVFDDEAREFLDAVARHARSATS